MQLKSILLIMGLFGFFGRSSASDSSKPTKLVEQAIDLSDKGDYDGAVRILTKAIAAEPKNAQAYFERGMALLNRDRDAEAIKDFDQALAIQPEFPGARDWRARAASALGDHARAADDRWKDLHAHPDGPHTGMGVNPQQWADCAESFVKAGNSLEARKVLEDYFANYTGKVTSYANYETAPMRAFARLLLQAGDSVRALEFARRAYGSKHRSPVDLLVYAQSLAASGDLENARKFCSEAMKLNDQMPGLKELNERLSK